MNPSLTITCRSSLHTSTPSDVACAALKHICALFSIPFAHTTTLTANTAVQDSTPHPSSDDSDPSLIPLSPSRDASSDDTEEDQPWHDSYSDGNGHDDDDYNNGDEGDDHGGDQDGDEDEFEDEDDPILQALKLADQANEEGNFQVALTHINHALTLFLQNPVPDLDDHAHLLEFRAMVYHDLCQHNEAIRDLTDAIDLWEHLIPRDTQSLIVALGNRALIHRSLGNRETALEDLQAAIEYCKLLDPPDVLLLASQHSTRGVIYYDLEKYNLGERELDTSIAYTQSAAPQDIESLIMDLVARARCRHMQGNQQGSTEDINRSFELYKSLTPENLELLNMIESQRKILIIDTVIAQIKDGTRPIFRPNTP